MAGQTVRVPTIDYAGIYYADILKMLIKYRRENVPEMTDENEYEPYVQLERAYSLVGHLNNTLLDVVANESLLPTAKLLESVRNHLKLIGYTLSQATPASADVIYELSKIFTATVEFIPQYAQAGTEETEDRAAITYESMETYTIDRTDETTYVFVWVAGQIEIIDNALEIGDTITINNAPFSVGTHFLVGTDKEASATNFANAINNSSDDNIFGKIKAITNGVKLSIINIDDTTPVNIVLQDNVTANFIVSNGEFSINYAGKANTDSDSFTPFSDPKPGDCMYFAHAHIQVDRVKFILDSVAEGIDGVWEYYDGELEDETPTSVTNLGPNLKFDVSSLLPEGTNASGTVVRVKLQETSAYEDCISFYEGGVNYIQTSELLGQSSPSTDIGDYVIGSAWQLLPELEDETSQLTREEESIFFQLPETINMEWEKRAINSLYSGYFLRFRIVAAPREYASAVGIENITDVTFTADNIGFEGNDIYLVFTGDTDQAASANGSGNISGVTFTADDIGPDWNGIQLLFDGVEEAAASATGTGNISGVNFQAQTPGSAGNSISLSFDGVVATYASSYGVTNIAGVKFTADNIGAIGNSISLLFDGDNGSNATATGTGNISTVNFIADDVGDDGNSISLVFNGTDDLDTVVGAWNTANPGNTVSHTGLGTTVPDAQTVNLSGGSDATTLDSVVDAWNTANPANTVSHDGPGDLVPYAQTVDLDGGQDQGDTLDSVVNAWNVANPANQVSHDGVGTTVPDAQTVNLSGGQDEGDTLDSVVNAWNAANPTLTISHNGTGTTVPTPAQAVTLQNGTYASTIKSVTDAWNAANPTNTVSHNAADELVVPDAQNVDLEGGSFPVSPDIDRVKIDEGSQYVKVYATQGEFREEDPLGSSDGSANQEFTLTYAPLIEGSLVIEIDEGTGFTAWNLRENFLTSGASSKDYVLEIKADDTAIVKFGDNRRGKIPAAGVDNIRAHYRVGADQDGNTGAKTITDNKSGISFVNRLWNPRQASGWTVKEGSTEEDLEKLKIEGPASIRVLGRGITIPDIEYLATQYRNEAGSELVSRATGIEETFGVKTIELIVVGTGGVQLPITDRQEIQDYFNGNKELGIDGVALANHEVTVVNYTRKVIDIDVTVYGGNKTEIENAIRNFVHPEAFFDDGITHRWKFSTEDTTEYFRRAILYSIIQNVDPISISNVVINSPTEDLALDLRELPFAGEISVTVV